MHIRPHVATAAVLAGCLMAVSAHAQEHAASSPDHAPANLAHVEGVVDVVLEGVSEPADPPVMLLDGDVVRTRAGRAEIVLGDGSLLHLAEGSSLEVLDDDRVRLTTGRASLRMTRDGVRRYVIDTPAGSVRLVTHGEYLISAEPGGALEVAVVRGAAEVVADRTWPLRGGQMLTVESAAARPVIASFNSARPDALAQWADSRTHAASAATSASRVPPPLRPYAHALDAYGRWDYLEPHGYVWFPSVGASWRPYVDGAWTFTKYGWTWRGRDRWAWPTHHYGRWGFTGVSWFWIPAAAWAPAWVTWSVASGYVGWAPLGWHTPARMNGWTRRDHPAYAPNYEPWRGWTVLPREHFAPRRAVRPHAIPGERLDGRTRDALLSGAITPDVGAPRPGAVGGAVPRHAVEAPITRGDLRALPERPAPRATDAPPRRAPDAPAYAPPPDGSNERATERSPRDRAGRGDVPADRIAPGQRQRDGAPRDRRGAPAEPAERRGAVRAPSARGPARETPPAGQAPSAAPARPQSEEGGAVPRSGAARRKG